MGLSWWKMNLGNTGYLHILNRPILPKNILRHQIWKKSFFLILGDMFQHEWHLFLLLRLGKKANLEIKFSVWSQSCSSITFLFELSLNRCRISNRNPQRRKCYVFQWGWGGGKEVRKGYSSFKDNIIQCQRWNTTWAKLKYISKVGIAHCWGSLDFSVWTLAIFG